MTNPPTRHFGRG